jgi:Cu2+-exporting ATPase
MSCCTMIADPSDVPLTADQRCFHCEVPLTDEPLVAVQVGQARYPLCSAACAAAAAAIVDGGLADYYELRTVAPDTRGRGAQRDADHAVFDNPRVQDDFVTTLPDGNRQAQLVVEGLRCAGCVWVTERSLMKMGGVESASINYATRRANVVWDPDKVRLSDILDGVASLGYDAFPYNPGTREVMLAVERRRAIERIGVAGAFGMQVMMIAIALYAGDFSGIEANLRDLLIAVSAVLTLPVLLYSARPFYAGAWMDIRAGRVGMDVPIALGMSLAYLGSVYAAWTGEGEVYFDSVVMFTLALLLARYIEVRVSRRGAAYLDEQLRAMPAVVRCVPPPGGEAVSMLAADVVAGDRIVVLPGETIAVDGVVESGGSSVDEALLTGESHPRRCGPGDELLGGSVNIDSMLTLVAVQPVSRSTLARIVSLVDSADRERPPLVRLADRTASVFLFAILVLAVFVAVGWLWVEPDRALEVTICVLVATCPCALSLAMPTAHAAGTTLLVRDGLVPTRGGAIEALARVTHVVLDKTGTLSEGRPRVVAHWTAAAGVQAAKAIAVAVAIERNSEHPIASAVAAIDPELLRSVPVPGASDVANTPGGGLSAMVHGRRFWLGSAAYVQRMAGREPPRQARAQLDSVNATEVWLADCDGIVAGFACRDRLRVDARELVEALQLGGRRVEVLSGDQPAVIAEVNEHLGADAARGALQPQDKLARVKELQALGGVVLAVGDGINDAPLLAAADVSIAMGGGSMLAKSRADWVLMNDRLNRVATALTIARKTMRVVRQNFAWAVAYNLAVLPAAALGLLAPWQAALGMSVSSLLVVLNAARLAMAPAGDRPGHPEAPDRPGAATVPRQASR